MEHLVSFIIASTAGILARLAYIQHKEIKDLRHENQLLKHIKETREYKIQQAIKDFSDKRGTKNNLT
jgi:hypothetical protein